MLNVKIEFVKESGSKHTPVDGVERHLKRITVEDKELMRNQYIIGLIVVPQLVEVEVEVMNGDLAVSLVEGEGRQ